MDIYVLAAVVLGAIFLAVATVAIYAFVRWIDRDKE
jgi:hypothetical protein